MKTIVVLALFFSGIVFNLLYAQNSELVSIVKPGDCYVRCFDLDKKWEFKKIPCSEVNAWKQKMYLSKENDSLDFKTRLIAHQKMLIKLGYKLEVTGILDDRTTKAHNKFIRKEKRKKKNKNNK